MKSTIGQTKIEEILEALRFEYNLVYTTKEQKLLKTAILALEDLLEEK